jgi:hypothetical protein
MNGDKIGAKMDELNDMTVNQIKELHQKRMQEQNNMTWSELKEENQKLWQISEIMDYARCGHDARNSASESGSIPFMGLSEGPA